jgi:Subtilase family
MQPPGRGPRGSRSARLWPLAAAVALACAGVPQGADAWWQRIAPTRTGSAPYDVCPHEVHRLACQLIDDPTPGARRRGPIPAGTITQGPAQEVSPALSGGGVDGGYDPQELRAAYELEAAAMSAGADQTVAVVDAYVDPDAEKDMNAYRGEYGIAPCTEAAHCFRQVDEAGTKPSPKQAPTLAEEEELRRWGEETAIDLDMVSAICPNCHIALVEASSTEDARVAEAENEAAKLGATEISDSFGESTPPIKESEAAAYDHPGIPIAAAAGDYGYGIEWPAANPHVIAVGGTVLERAGDRGGWTETVWPMTGSGCSSEPKPEWQAEYPDCVGRVDNDVAAVASPNTPVSAYDTYLNKTGWLLAGGTSVSTPIVAAAMALASDHTRSFEGAEALYLERPNGIDGFFDVRSGSNGSCGTYLCLAKAGYDGPSGLGGLRGVPEVPPPAPVTDGAGAAGGGRETLEASVNAHDSAITLCQFEYGTTAAYGSAAACSAPLPTGGTVAKPVSASIPVIPGTTYHYRIEVSYPGGAATGEDASFTAQATAPRILAQATTDVGQTSATLTATVDPDGAAVTCAFEYGTSASYGSLAYCGTPGAGAGEAIAVYAHATGLRTNTLYHYRLVAENGTTPEYATDATFTTLPPAPAVTTLAASSVGTTSATLNATVDPEGAALTTCEFELAGALVPCSGEAGGGETPVSVSARVGGLVPGRSYEYRLVAANAGGRTSGNIQELLTALTLSSPPLTQSPLASTRPAGTVHSQGDDRSPRPCVPGLGAHAVSVAADGVFRLVVRCAAAGGESRGTITLRLAHPVGSTRARSVLAVAAFALRAGQRMMLTLRLSRQTQRLLARARTLHAHATIDTDRPLAVASSVAVSLHLRGSPS